MGFNSRLIKDPSVIVCVFCVRMSLIHFSVISDFSTSLLTRKQGLLNSLRWKISRTISHKALKPRFEI